MPDGEAVQPGGGGLVGAALAEAAVEDERAGGDPGGDLGQGDGQVPWGTSQVGGSERAIFSSAQQLCPSTSGSTVLRRGPVGPRRKGSAAPAGAGGAG